MVFAFQEDHAAANQPLGLAKLPHRQTQQLFPGNAFLPGNREIPPQLGNQESRDVEDAISVVMAATIAKTALAILAQTL